MIMNANSQTNFGIQAGLNSSKIKTIHDGKTVDGNSTMTNFYLKGYANIFFNNNISLQPGIALISKGGREPSSFATYNYQSLDIPVNILYHVPLTNGSAYVGAGLFAGMNLSGKIKFDDGGSEDLEFGPILDSSEDEWKRIDYGINFLTGYRLSNGFLVNIGYSLGLSDIDPRQEWKRNSSVWSFGIGYEF